MYPNKTISSCFYRTDRRIRVIDDIVCVLFMLNYLSAALDSFPFLGDSTSTSPTFRFLPLVSRTFCLHPWERFWALSSPHPVQRFRCKSSLLHQDALLFFLCFQHTCTERRDQAVIMHACSSLFILTRIYSFHLTSRNTRLGCIERITPSEMESGCLEGYGVG